MSSIDTNNIPDNIAGTVPEQQEPQQAQLSPLEAMLAKTAAEFAEKYPADKQAGDKPARKNKPQAERAVGAVAAEAADAGAQAEAEGAAAAPTGPGFDTLGLSRELVIAVRDSGYTSPTEVQLQAIPAALAGRDLRVSSSTGSGKTAAFVLPALQRILDARGQGDKRRAKGMTYGPRMLVLAPTRELALQVAKACSTYGKHIQGLRVATVVGGVPYGAQLKALRGPLDILIATPGRLLDHLGTGAAVLSSLEVLVLDEADRMLDMGFIDDIQAIAAVTPAERQTMMFSATFAGHVGRLAEQLTRDPQRIDVSSHTESHANIEQRLYWFDHTGHKHDLLDHFLTERSVDQAVVFTATQYDADKLADRLADMGHAVAALHGGMPQGKRNRVLQALRQRQLRVLVATDVAARGIDVPTITHVVNYGLPMKAEDYVHRIGRTGRAGRSGLAITLAGRDDQHMIRRIERFTTQRIPVATVPGMEPTKAVPFADQGRGGKPGPKFNKPMPGQRHGQGARREGGYGRPQGEGFGGGPREGFGGPREGGFEGQRFDRAPRFEPRRDGPAGGHDQQRRGPGGFNAGGFGRPQGPAPARDDNWFEPAAGAPRAGKPGGFGHHDDRRGGGFAPRGDKPAFGQRFEGRGEGQGREGFKPGGGFAPRSHAGKPGGFGGKPSFGGKPGFGGKKPGGPGRPRD